MKRLFVVFTLAAAVCGLSAAAHAQISIAGEPGSTGVLDWSTHCSTGGFCFYFNGGYNTNGWLLSVGGGDSADGTRMTLGSGGWGLTPTGSGYYSGSLNFAGGGGDTFTAGNLGTSGVLSGTMATGTLTLSGGTWVMSFNMTSLSLQDCTNHGCTTSAAFQALKNAGSGTLTLKFSAAGLGISCVSNYTGCSGSFLGGNNQNGNFGSTGGSLVSPTPEPVSLGLFATGLLPSAWWLRRRRWGKAN